MAILYEYEKEAVFLKHLTIKIAIKHFVKATFGRLANVIIKSKSER